MSAKPDDDGKVFYIFLHKEKNLLKEKRMKGHRIFKKIKMSLKRFRV